MAPLTVDAAPPAPSVAAARPLPRWLFAALAAPALAYLVLRAWLVPLSYDEAANYQRYVLADPLAVLDFSVATNHLLNTLLTRMSAALFGNAPLALRLPNVLASVGYVVACAGLASMVRHRAVALAGFVLLVANPYVLEYFALSRGYGLSVALLTASLWYLCRWLSEWPRLSRTRGIAASLALAVTAVAANFSVLPALLAMVVVAAAAWMAARAAGTAPPPGGRLGPRAWHVAAWLAVAVLYSGIVIGRDAVLSESLFEPVTVRIAGLFEDELDEVRVYRGDSRERVRELHRRPGGIWQTDGLHHAWGLRVELPERAERNMASLDVTMGDRAFRRDRRDGGPWHAQTLGGTRRLDATTTLSLPRSANPPLSRAINWRGDAAHRRLVVRATALAVMGLGAFGLMAWACAGAVARLGLLPRDTARLLCVALVWTVTIAAAPIVLLRRNVQLYFGGNLGLLPDTFGSLARGWLRDADYWARQESFLIAVLLLPALVLPPLVVVRPSLRVRAAPAIGLWALFTLVVVQVLVQRHGFGTPYLMGRTALFLMPVVAALALLVADLVAAAGPRRARMSSAGAAIVATVAVAHAVATADVTRTFDWPRDAETPAMLAHVADATASTRPRPGVVRIGVEWIFYPAARYYAALQSTPVTRYDIVVVPTVAQDLDYVYTERGSSWASGELVTEFPTAGAELRRVTPPR